MTRQITTYENYYRIAFSYSPMIVSAVKEIPGRRFDPISKSWLVPLVSKEAVEAFAKRFGFQWGTMQRAEEVGEIPPLPELGIDIPLGIDLFPYQKQGVAYCLEHPHTIIGDKPGLGIEINEEECLKHPYQPHTLRHYTGALTDIRPPESKFYF